jgi:hypothetical protein
MGNSVGLWGESRLQSDIIFRSYTSLVPRLCGVLGPSIVVDKR